MWKGCQPYTPAAFTLQEIPLVLTFLKRLSRPQGHSAAGRIKSKRNPNDLSGIEPPTSWLAAQRLNFITRPNRLHSCCAATANMPTHLRAHYLFSSSYSYSSCGSTMQGQAPTQLLYCIHLYPALLVSNWKFPFLFMSFATSPFHLALGLPLGRFWCTLAWYILCFLHQPSVVDAPTIWCTNRTIFDAT